MKHLARISAERCPAKAESMLEWQQKGVALGAMGAAVNTMAGVLTTFSTAANNLVGFVENHVVSWDAKDTGGGA